MKSDWSTVALACKLIYIIQSGAFTQQLLYQSCVSPDDMPQETAGTIKMKWAAICAKVAADTFYDLLKFLYNSSGTSNYLVNSVLK